MQAILTLNSGSSSIKFAVFCLQGEEVYKKYSGVVTDITQNPHIKIKSRDNIVILNQRIEAAGLGADIYTEVTNQILAWVTEQDIEIIAAGHRVAHGGVLYRKATLLNEKVVNDLAKLIPLAPLHQPYNLNGVTILAGKFPFLLQVACFDTAFHTTCNPLSQMFALPEELREEGVRRYGFHGLSYDYVVSQLDQYLPPDKADGKIIIAHLGQGATMCAVAQRKSVATSIGFSALDGLPMGTRCGSLDAGVVLYLLAEKQMSYKEIEKLLFKKSGLFGVSGGISSDMKVLLSSDGPYAKLAVDLFTYRVSTWLGTLAAELQGLDVIIFTAGIGENAPYIRAEIGKRAAWLGVKIDPELNATNSPIISTQDSKIVVCVIPTDEEQIIARQTLQQLAAKL